MDFELSQREKAVFAEVVSSYLQTAAPVGSQAVARALAEKQRLLSSATVRSLMAELEGAGLLTHPHTSAGRIPTPQGLRLYVDCLIETEPLSEDYALQIAERYAAAEPGIEAIVQETSRILARLSQYAGLIVTPVRRELKFHYMEFVRLSSQRLLGIFVTREGVTQNRIIELDRVVSSAEVERINNYCNSVFAGLTLAEAIAKSRQECRETAEAIDELQQRAMDYSAQVLSNSDEADLVIDGETSLLEQPEFAASAKAKSLLEALQQKQQMVELLEQSQQGDGVQVFIGGESRFDALHDCSVVMSPYRRSGKVLGTLGVIGPTRMAYGRVIPIVQCTAEQVSQWLENST